MDTKFVILNMLRDLCRDELRAQSHHERSWEHARQLRALVLRGRRGELQVWSEFLKLLYHDPLFADHCLRLLEALRILWIPGGIDPARVSVPTGTLPLTEAENAELLTALGVGSKTNRPAVPDQRFDPTAGEVMYVEWKPGNQLNGHARIGRVRKSRSGRTLRYLTFTLISLKGKGFKANYVEQDSGMQFWVSNCHRDGCDRLSPGIVEIDPSAREEYWMSIREMPENRDATSFCSEGKSSRRRSK